MSDALSEIARDQERSEKHEIFVLKLFEYLSMSTQEMYNSLKGSAREVDSVQRGYWYPGHTYIEERVDKTMEELQNRNPECWNFYINHAKNVSTENINEMIKALTNLRDIYPEFVISYLDIFD